MYETLEVAIATIDENGIPNAIIKRAENNTYCSIRKKYSSASAFKIGEKLKIPREITKNWHFYDESTYRNEYAKMQAVENKRETEIRQIFNSYRITYLYHMTHKSNLENILQYGLLSKHRVKDLQKIDVANTDVNNRREKNEPIYNKSIHDYVPLYFNPKNPMLFVRKHIQNDIVILAINIMILSQNNAIFTDGNAASKSTTFYSDYKKLENLDWSCINADYWSDHEDGKRKRCAEVLIYQNIPVSFITKIYCNNNETLNFVQKLTKIEAEIKPILYFNSWGETFDF